MNWRGVRWPVLAVSAAVTAALLFGGFALYRHQTGEGALARAYQRLPGVEGVSVQAGPAATEVTVALGPGLDLAATYPALVETADRLLGPGRYRLNLADRRDQAVGEAYHRLHFSLWEANTTGRFTVLAAEADRIAADAGLSRHRLDIGDTHIYVALEKDRRYLYAVVARQEG